MKCEKRRAARYANMASILHETHVRAVKRCSGSWRLPARVWKPVGGVRSVRHMGEPVEKVGPVRHTEARRKVRLARRMEACRSTHPFRRWQKMPQWGPIAWIWERAARKRHDGAFSRADILRLSFRKIT